MGQPAGLAKGSNSQSSSASRTGGALPQTRASIEASYICARGVIGVAEAEGFGMVGGRSNEGKFQLGGDVSVGAKDNVLSIDRQNLPIGDGPRCLHSYQQSGTEHGCSHCPQYY